MKGHARTIMTQRVQALAPETTLEDIVRTLDSGRFSGLPVVGADDHVLGFVSEIDVVDALLRNAPLETPARDIMSHPAIVIDEFAPGEEVMTVLRESNIHHLPVVREGRLVGIITPHDVLRHFVNHVLPQPPEVG
jgi:CBS domain-containing protein